jgi:ADP-ribosylglycohydrolase
MEKIKNKIFNCLLLSTICDIYGFFNGIVEFNFNFDFVSEDHISYINNNIIYYYFTHKNKFWLKKFHVSDDTLLLFATTKALLNGGGENNYVKEYYKLYKDIDFNNDIRKYGNNTKKSLILLHKFLKSNKKNLLFSSVLKSSKKMGGNGCAIRTATIGILYNDINKIITESFIASRVTHNYPIGYLGGIVSALFTNYAFNNIEPKEWINKLLILFENNTIINIINTFDNLGNNYKNFIDDYYYLLLKYKDTLYKKISNNYYDYDNVDRMKKLATFNPNYNNNFNFAHFGSTGIDSIIYAYDAFLIIWNNPQYFYTNISIESIIYFGSLHCGDSDSTGAILGAWSGAYFGNYKIKDYEYNEKYNDIIYLSNKLYKKLVKLSYNEKKRL